MTDALLTTTDIEKFIRKAVKQSESENYMGPKELCRHLNISGREFLRLKARGLKGGYKYRISDAINLL